jgi:hypothetical protein
MLCSRGRVAVYCKKCKEHINTLCGTHLLFLCYSRWNILFLRDFKWLIMKTKRTLFPVSNESYVPFITKYVIRYRF